MKSRTHRAIAGLLLATLVAVGPASASDQRPLTGRFTAQVAPAEPRCGPDALTLGFVIQGTAAHLGSFTGTGSNCTEFTLATSAVAVWDGIATLVAADGSTITTTSEGHQAAPIDGRATFAIVHTIAGGSGRFDGASGVWTVSGVIDFTTGQLEGQVTGWVSY